MLPGAPWNCEPLGMPRVLLAAGPLNRNRNLRKTFGLGVTALVLAACSPGPGAQILG